MRHTFRKYDGEVFSRIGDAIYEECVQPILKKSDHGKFVAIDIDSGEFEIDEDERTAVERLRARHENPQIWMIRAGTRYVRHFGGRLVRSKS